MTERRLRKAWVHLAELGAIVLIATSATIAVYARVFPAMAIATPYGVAISVLLAAGLAFHRIYRFYGLVPALCSALAVATLSGGLSLFGLLNILGARMQPAGEHRPLEVSDHRSARLRSAVVDQWRRMPVI